MATHKRGASSPHCQRQLADNKVTSFKWLLARLLEGFLKQPRRRPVPPPRR